MNFYNSKVFLFFTFCLFVCPFIASAQELEDDAPLPEIIKNSVSVLTRDSVPDLAIEDTTQEDTEKKVKKKPKKIFYGLKCRKGFTKVGVGKRQVIELFYYLKKPVEIDPYVRDIYIWDIEKRKITTLSDKKQINYRLQKILHGPYKKMIGGDVVETGIFYKGTKHGRWETYGREKTDEIKNEEVSYSILLEKSKFYKGWPKESRFTYYDANHTKLKEVYPFENGQLNGTYYMFLGNGQIFRKGEYEQGKKVGLWFENFKDREKRRKEVQYPETPYEDKKPYVLKEWDDLNNLIILNGEKVEPGQKIETDPLKRHFQKKHRR